MHSTTGQTQWCAFYGCRHNDTISLDQTEGIQGKRLGEYLNARLEACERLNTNDVQNKAEHQNNKNVCVCNIVFYDYSTRSSTGSSRLPPVSPISW